MTVTPAMSTQEQVVLDQIQKELPLVPRPFAEWGKEVGLSEGAFIETVQNLIDRKLVFRLGPRFDPLRFGGGDALMALSVPEEDLPATTRLLQGIDHIAHAHLRDNAYNVWCVLMTEKAEDMNDAVNQVSQKTGLKPLLMPMVTDYHGQQNRARGIWQPDDVNRRLILATQAGLPLVPHPFQTVAHWVGIDTREVLSRLAHLHQIGVIRQITGVLHRYNLGQHDSALCAWAVPKEKLAELGPLLAAKSFLVRASERPAASADWPYTLYGSVYGEGREQTLERIAAINETILAPYQPGVVMFTLDVLKKRGLRFRLAVPTS